MMHTVESLISFRERVVSAFTEKKIRSPIHLPSDGQALPLLKIFARFRPGVDWLFSGWRSMWHCLLAGMPEEELFQAILYGRSMFIQSREHRIFCSSIVGGILPIACGKALRIKERNRDEWVYCFCGDMTATTGVYQLARQFQRLWKLPMRFVVEDNQHSTDTPTFSVWGGQIYFDSDYYYRYERTVPHVGCGVHVEF